MACMSVAGALRASSGEIAFPCANAAPQQITDILRSHSLPILDIEMGVLHLRTFSVIVGKCPIPHGGVSKAPMFQIRYGLTVTAGFLLRLLPVKPFLLALAGTGEQPPF